jgi:hypothetical protein
MLNKYEAVYEAVSKVFEAVRWVFKAVPKRFLTRKPGKYKEN